MSQLLYIEGTGKEGLEIEFALDFAGWDRRTARVGREATWTIYFGGVRYVYCTLALASVLISDRQIGCGA